MNLYLSHNRRLDPFTIYRNKFGKVFDDLLETEEDVKEEQNWVPSCEIEESEKNYTISLELAGVPKDSIKIEFSDQILTVTGERTRPEKSQKDSNWRSERKYGKFQRKFSLPQGIDEDNIVALQKEGVLHLTVPKLEVKKSKQISIRDEAS